MKKLKMLLDAMRGGGRWLVVAMVVVAGGGALANPIVVECSRVDTIRGISQTNTFAVGYFADADDGLSGVTGGAGSRRCHVPVIQFELPALPAGQVVESVTINYLITASRDHAGTAFDAHVYLLESHDPSGTGTNFYFHGASDSNPDVRFAGASTIAHSGTGSIVHDPPLERSITLSGAALELFASFYDGNDPNQGNAYFRFNRSTFFENSAADPIGGSGINRFIIDPAAENLFLEITTAEPPTWARATGGDASFVEEIDGEFWQIHMFTNVGTFAEGLEITTPGLVEYLIVGGGGGGGARKSNDGGTSGGGAGGGGAGGLLTGSFVADATTYEVRVGNAGAGGSPGNNAGGSAAGNDGGVSSVFGFEALGGGGGAAGGGGTSSIIDGRSGGSGGGGASSTSGTLSDGGPGEAGQGFGGGSGASLNNTSGNRSGGGGGGAAGSGLDGELNIGGAGGPGISTNFTGSTLVIAGGGGGGVENSTGRTPGAGGSGVGGAGGAQAAGSDATSFGSGGGGAGRTSSSSNSEHPGGSGYSGLVVVRYVIPSVVWSAADTTNITQTAAWATATVNADLTEAVLVWNETDLGTASTNDWPNRLSLGSQDAGEVTEQIAGLSGGTEYFWRLYGVSAETNGWSAAIDFITLAPPAVSVLEADDVLALSATLRGELTVGGNATAFFVWGTETPTVSNDTNNWQHVVEIGNVIQDEVFTHPLSGLDPETQYFYSIFVTNEVDEAWSGVEDFTTPASMTIFSPSGSSGDWNNGANWSQGVPTGIIDALITEGKTADVDSSTTPVFTGSVILEDGATIDTRNNDANLHAFGTESITLNTESRLVLRRGDDVTFAQDIILLGDADISNTGNSTDNEDRFVDGVVSGGGQLTYFMRRGNTFRLNASNPDWSGGLVANFTDTNFGNASRVFANAVHSLGTGDVTMNDGIGLVIEVSGALDAGASLYLNERGHHHSSWRKLRLNADETVNMFYLDGVPLAAGEYNSGSGLVDSVAGNPLITGIGTLTVLGISITNTVASNASQTTADLGGLLDAPLALSEVDVSVYWSTNENTTAAEWLADTAASNVFVDTYSLVTDEVLNTTVTDLEPGTTYYYTYVATNANSQFWASPTASFFTLAPAALPEVDAIAATSILPFSATIGGVPTAGGTVEAFLVWGDSLPDPADNTNNWQHVVHIGTRVTGVDFSLDLTGLSAPQTYYYRAFVTNEAGVAWSATESFNTPAYLNIMTANAGGNDSWNNAANWSLNRVPTGFDWAVINTNVAAEVDAVPPSYNGELILREGASLRVRNTSGAEEALDGEKIVLHEGSEIRVDRGTAVTLPPIELQGDATFNSGGSHHEHRHFNGAITGPHTLTLTSVNNNRLNLNTANTFTNLISNASDRHTIHAYAAGSLGLGDVTINRRSSDQRSAVLVIHVENAFSTSATLTLNDARGWNGSSGGDFGGTAYPLRLNANATINRLFVDGIQLNAGVYDNAEWWLHGSGELTVLTGPPAIPPELVSITDDVFGNTIYENYGTILFTVTFDIAMDPATITTADFENRFNAAVSIDAVTEVTPSTYGVSVTVQGPGDLQLQIPQGADVRSSVDEPMDTSAAIPDGKIITVLPGNAPTTTITGTAGGNDSWNEPANWNFGIPSGEQDAIVAADLTAGVDSSVTPAYSGNLTLSSGAELVIRSGAGNVNALGTDTITFGSGAELVLSISQDIIFSQNLYFAGDGQIRDSGNPSHHNTRHFEGVISGTGSFTLGLERNKVNEIRGPEPNTWSGGFIANRIGSGSTDPRVRASKNGAFGTGDVTINDFVSLIIDSGTSSTINDSATLYLNGDGYNSSWKLELNSDETIYSLVIDGEVQRMGTYGSTSSVAIYQDDDLFSGSGVLEVLGPIMPSVFRFR